jgi:hypothetical protein
VTKEVLRHVTICRRLAQVSKGRESTASQILQFMLKFGAKDKGVETLLLTGSAGQGKSSLISRVLMEASTQLKEIKANIVFRYIGATHESSSVLLLVKSICNQLGTPYPRSNLELTSCLNSALSSASEDHPLILILDGIDELVKQDPLNLELRWLIPSLTQSNNPFVRVILTANTSPHIMSPCVNSVQRSLLSATVLPIPPLQFISPSINDGAQLLNQLLSHRNLPPFTDKQQQLFMESVAISEEDFGGISPLYLEYLVIGVIPKWTSTDLPPFVPATIQECFDACLDLIESIQTGSTQDLNILLLSLITASRDGLSATEIQLMLPQIQATQIKETLDKLVTGTETIFGKEHLLLSYSKHDALYSWNHSVAKDVAAYRYLGITSFSEWMGSEYEVDPQSLKDRHKIGGLISEGMMKMGGVGSGPTSKWSDRAARELPRALALAGKWEELHKLILDPFFVSLLCKVMGGASAVSDEIELFRRAGEEAMLVKEVEALSGPSSKLTGFLWDDFALVSDLLRYRHQAIDIAIGDDFLGTLINQELNNLSVGAEPLRKILNKYLERITKYNEGDAHRDVDATWQMEFEAIAKSIGICFLFVSFLYKNIQTIFRIEMSSYININ